MRLFGAIGTLILTCIFLGVCWFSMVSFFSAGSDPIVAVISLTAFLASLLAAFGFAHLTICIITGRRI